MRSFHFFFHLILLYSTLSLATGEKKIHLEWESLPGAKYYDLELTPVAATENGKGLTYQTQVPEWTGSLSPGKYQMKIRARDRRKAPGEWSAAEELIVSLNPVKILAPISQAELKTLENEISTVEFDWESVPGAKEYFVEILSEDGKFHEAQVATDSHLSWQLPVAKSYTWSVTAKVSDDLTSERVSSTFNLWGKKLEAPMIQEVKTLGGVTWSQPEHSEKFEYHLSRLNPTSKKWETVKADKEFGEAGVPLENSWIGGQYLLTVKAKAPLRETSDRSQSRFAIEDLNRRPANLDTFVLKKNWDRPRGAFVFAQQLISNMDYTSSNMDNTQHTDFSGLGGSLEVGGGYWNEPDLGGHLSIEMGMLTDGASKYPFSKTELSGIHRENHEGEETRHYFGIFAKEVPMVSKRFDTEDLGFVSVAGPLYGYERIYFLSEKYGFLWNAKAYFNLLKMQTPNSEQIVPSISGRLGLWGRYKIDPTTTGFLGYTFRTETIKYRPVTADPDNIIEFEGHFLNFYVEWDI